MYNTTIQLVVTFLCFSPFIALGVLLWIFRPRHTWEYRNPYDRTCRVCKRHEVSHCWSMETWNKSWWEVFSDGDGSCEKKKK